MQKEERDDTALVLWASLSTRMKRLPWPRQIPKVLGSFFGISETSGGVRDRRKISLSFERLEVSLIGGDSFLGLLDGGGRSLALPPEPSSAGWGRGAKNGLGTGRFVLFQFQASHDPQKKPRA